MQQSVQKRARQQLSCTACRHGKLRCNRQQPCDQCLKRSKASSCQYLAPPEKKRKARNTKDRIAHLEGLVVQLMGQNNTTGSTSSPGSVNGSDSARESSSNSPPVSSETSSKNGYSEHSYGSASVTTGQLKVSRGETHYHGSAHWEAILEDIAGIKAELGDEEEEEAPGENESASYTPLLVLGAPSPLSREHLIQSVPAKGVVDRLLWNWFQSPDPSLPIIHKPTFIQEYDQFWQDPSQTPTIWLAILFSIMSLGGRLARNKDQWSLQFPADTTTHTPQQFQDLAACAISLADYTKPKKYTIEALFLYASCEYMRQDDSQVRLWLFMAIVLRTALRMGYHRDSDHYPSITPFEGEMRRRLWYSAYTFDVLTSFQLGLPGIVLSVESDTQKPRNLLDTDFGPESTCLPPSRPLSESSPITYVIVKSDLAAVFAKAAIISQAVKEPSFSEVMEIDQELTRVHEDFPEVLKFTSMNQSIADSPGLIFSRFKIELLYQKTRCVLHRRYLTEKLSDPRMEYSRGVCVEAAMQLLQHHGAVYEASQGSGPLSSTRWFMSSLNAHDFLLGAMVLCLELNLIQKASNLSEAPGSPDAERVDEMKRLLQRSYEIYSLPVRHFANTGKALKVMEIMLEKAGSLPKSAADVPRNGTTPGLSDTFFGDNIAQPLELLSIDQATSAAMMPSMDSTDYAPIGGMLDLPQELDWQSWDDYINQHGNEKLNLDLSLTGLDPEFLGNPLNGDLSNNFIGVNQNSWI